MPPGCACVTVDAPNCKLCMPYAAGADTATWLCLCSPAPHNKGTCPPCQPADRKLEGVLEECTGSMCFASPFKQCSCNLSFQGQYLAWPHSNSKQREAAGTQSMTCFSALQAVLGAVPVEGQPRSGEARRALSTFLNSLAMNR